MRARICHVQIIDLPVILSREIFPDRAIITEIIPKIVPKKAGADIELRLPHRKQTTFFLDKSRRRKRH
jgi:hypothetical protein